MLKIGNTEVLYSGQVILSKGEDVWVDFPLPKWSPLFNILIIDDPSDPKQHVEISDKKTHGEIKLVNCATSENMTNPIQVARSEGRSIKFFAAISANDNVLKLHFQFLLDPPEVKS